jgi:putative ABC transport system permease protein
MASILQQLRFAIRILVKSPCFAVVAVLMLALGIGSTTTIFTVVESILLRPLPYPHAEQIVKVGSAYRGSPYSGEVIRGAQYRFLQEHDRSFESVEIHDVVTSGVNISGGTEPEHLVSAAVSAGFFRVLGVAPVLGRAFTDEEDRPGGPCAVVLTDGLWRRRYTGDTAIVGRTIALNDESCLVTGVLPPSFRFDQNAELFMPIHISAAPRDLGHYYFMLARLKPGVTPDQARTEMPAIFASFKATYADLVDSDETGIQLKSYLEWMVGDVRPSLWVLLGAVGLVLLISCSNVANLLLSRAVGRTKEMAIRAALGAGRRRLAQQLIMESALLACAGGGFGLLMAHWGISALRRIAPSGLPRAADISLDLRVVGFAIFLSAFTVLVFGLVPMLQASRVDVNASLKAANGRTSAGVGRVRTRKSLVAAEVAFSFMLLTGAVLLLRSFVALITVPRGFDPTSVLTFRMAPSPRYSTTPRMWDFERQVLERLDAIPGVDKAASATCLPLENGPDMPSSVLGRSQSADFNPSYRSVSPDYFRSLEIPILRGRSFTDSDTSDSTAVIMINDSVARQIFKDRDPLGEHIQLGVGLGAEYADPPRVIVGVAGDVRESSLDHPARITVFIPRAQVPSGLTGVINRLAGMSWVVRTKIPPAQLNEAVRRTILAIDPQQPISDVRTMEQMMSTSVERHRFTLLLMTLFATLGVLLAAVGIYGVISYIFAQRTYEIGIRTALGAQRGDILKMVIGNGLEPALIGLAIGIACALALTRFFSSVLFEVGPTDPVTFLAVTFLMLGVTLLACYVPARRATRVDPVIALRYE